LISGRSSCKFSRPKWQTTSAVELEQICHRLAGLLLDPSLKSRRIQNSSRFSAQFIKTVTYLGIPQCSSASLSLDTHSRERPSPVRALLCCGRSRTAETNGLGWNSNMALQRERKSGWFDRFSKNREKLGNSQMSWAYLFRTLFRPTYFFLPSPTPNYSARARPHRTITTFTNCRRELHWQRATMVAFSLRRLDSKRGGRGRHTHRCNRRSTEKALE